MIPVDMVKTTHDWRLASEAIKEVDICRRTLTLLQKEGRVPFRYRPSPTGKGPLLVVALDVLKTIEIDRLKGSSWKGKKRKTS